MKQRFLTFLAVIFMIPAAGFAVVPGDSIGVKIINGKVYILYRVTKGDNLSQIGREYNVGAGEMLQANRMDSPDLYIGQVVRVPTDRTMLLDEEFVVMQGEVNKVVDEKVAEVEAAEAHHGTEGEVIAMRGESNDHHPEEHAALTAEESPEKAVESTSEDLSEEMVAELEAEPWVEGYVAMRGEPVGDEVEKPVAAEVEEVKKEEKLEDMPDVLTEEDIPFEEVVLMRGEESKEKVDLDKINEKKEEKVADKVEKAATYTEEEVTERIDRLEEKELSARNANADADEGEGKKHKVAQGETLYAISRKYAVSVSDIQKWNSLESTALSIGQTLWVSNPVGTSSPRPVNKAPKNVDNSQKGDHKAEKIKTSKDGGKGGMHVVSPGETLFGIAKKYGMNATDLSKMNGLDNSTIKVGQKLRIKSAKTGNPNQGTALMDMMTEVTETKSTTDKTEGTEPAEKDKSVFPELKVLTADVGTTVPPEAKTSVYTDRGTGLKFRR
ncbi:MAG: LysM peptidoglycan-binding domain-containing protein, partial [Bacteroidota bacterium]